MTTYTGVVAVVSCHTL